MFLTTYKMYITFFDQFDIYFVIETIKTMFSKTFVWHLNDIKQYIDKDSWIYIEVPNNPNAYIGTFHEHINFFNIESISALLKRNGFKIIDVFEYGFDLGIPAHKNNLCVLTKLEKDI